MYIKTKAHIINTCINMYYIGIAGSGVGIGTVFGKCY